MFVRRFSSLPPDPIFPDDLHKLGYFINGQDEVRSIENPNNYFKYYINKNERWNERHAFAMNTCLGREIRWRLQDLGLRKVFLQPDPEDARRVPIFASGDLAARRRMVLIVGEPTQDLGVLTPRVVLGPGGIDVGSMVSVARDLLPPTPEGGSIGSSGSSAGKGNNLKDKRNAPGVVLANMGQLFWWEDGKRTLSPSARHAIPMPSAVHWGTYYDERRHAVPGHATPAEHLASVFRDVLEPVYQTPDYGGKGKGKEKDGRTTPKLSIIGIGDGAEAVEAFLNKHENWAVWGPRLECLAILGGFYDVKDVVVPGFRNFLREKSRAWIIAPGTPLNTPLSGPYGNPETDRFTSYGCPVFSTGGGEASWLPEMLMVDARAAVIGWLRDEVWACNDTLAAAAAMGYTTSATTDTGEEYEYGYINPQVIVTFADRERPAESWADCELSQGSPDFDVPADWRDDEDDAGSVVAQHGDDYGGKYDDISKDEGVKGVQAKEEEEVEASESDKKADVCIMPTIPESDLEQDWIV